MQTWSLGPDSHLVPNRARTTICGCGCAALKRWAETQVKDRAKRAEGESLTVAAKVGAQDQWRIGTDA